MSDDLSFQFGQFPCHVYSKRFDRGEIVLGGNNRPVTGSAGTFIPIIVPEESPCAIAVASSCTGKAHVTAEAVLGAKPYADRNYTITRLDKTLEGGLLLQTYVDDEDLTDEHYLVLRAEGPVRLYLAFNAVTSHLPAWMSGFVPHGPSAARTTPPPLPPPEKLGVAGLCGAVAEWCYDWHGPYAEEPQTDPAGPDAGMARVVRGNKLDEDTSSVLPHKRGFYYRRSANRAGMAPGFAYLGPPSGAGRHPIGFRVVQAPLPDAQPYAEEKPFNRVGVKQSTEKAAQSAGPPSDAPYFRKRYLLPTPPENSAREVIDAAGLHPSFRGHNHSPALEAMPNGDLLMVIFTSWNEYEPGMTLMATRLRFGADQWDMPSCLVDMPDACDNTPLLWAENGTVYLFWSNTRSRGGFPFQWITSNDSGGTWSETHFPRFATEIGPHSRQPINTMLRDIDGTVYLPSDAIGGSSVLWVSPDNMATWMDTGGRTGGRHTTFALLKDGRTILGMGGKSTDIDGYMPKSISHDGGKNWDVERTSFPAYGSNQRPCLIRLRSGRLFFCGDFQRIDGVSPDTVRQRGSFAALSDDEGQTWLVKKLPGTQPHENPEKLGGADTLGYSVARQAPNGIIHLITTMNRPCLHFAFNEAWIREPDETPGTDGQWMANTATSIADVQRHEETWSNGQKTATWHAGIGNDGRYLLHGEETWFYPDGAMQYQAHYALGRKVGLETFYYPSGAKAWEWQRAEDGAGTWTQWWPNGTLKATSVWKNLHADGPAKTWDRQGRLLTETDFVHGIPAGEG